MPDFFYNPATDVPGQWYISQREQVQKDLAAFDAAMGVQQPTTETPVTGAPTQATAEEGQ
jgi:hypothetical protein